GAVEFAFLMPIPYSRPAFHPNSSQPNTEELMSENISKHPGRRRFIANAGAGLAGAGLLTAKSYARVIGANDRIQMGVVGSGGRGRSVMGSFNRFSQQCEFIHVCDVYEPNINAALKLAREGARSTMDYKEL